MRQRFGIFGTPRAAAFAGRGPRLRGCVRCGRADPATALQDRGPKRRNRRWHARCLVMPRNTTAPAAISVGSARHLTRNGLLAMNALVNKLRTSALVRDTRGANMVEYIIVVGLVALIAIVGFTTFGGDVKQKIEDQATK